MYRESTYASLTGVCAGRVAKGATQRRTRPRRAREGIDAPLVEELAKSEMHHPARVRIPRPIHAVEAVRPVKAERPQWSHGRRPDANAAEQARWVELPWTVPDVAAVEEHIGVELRTDPHADLRRHREERIAERLA